MEQNVRSVTINIYAKQLIPKFNPTIVMKQKKYWQSFGELKSSENYQERVQDEFNELLDATSPRRDFLKYLGFSTAAAAAAASCEMPVKKSKIGRAHV